MKERILAMHDGLAWRARRFVVEVLLKHLLRLALGVTFGAVGRATGLLRFTWLAHYLLRDWAGQEVRVPAQIAQDVHIGTLAWAVARKGSIVEARDHKGAGFYGRPEVFYLVGGFAVEMEEDLDGKLVRLRARDVYDWHPARGWDGEPFYFASPLPLPPGEWAYRVAWWVNDLLGHTVLNAGPEGRLAVSNYFWEWLDGRPFISLLEWEFPLDEWSEALRWV